MKARSGKWIRVGWAVTSLLSFLSLLGAAGCSCASKSSLNARAMADALSDELTDEMEFDNGSVIQGAPPVEHDADPAFPQITQSQAPLYFQYGQVFEINLRTDFQPATDVVGAVIHVVQANTTDQAASYILIRPTPPALSAGFMYLKGRLADGSRVAGNAFTLKVGLLRGTKGGLGQGGVGNYIDLNLLTPPLDGTEPKVPHCTCLSGSIQAVSGCQDTLRDLTPEAECRVWAQAFAGTNTEMQGEVQSLPIPMGTRVSLAGAGASAPCVLELACSTKAGGKDLIPDADLDGVADEADNCPGVFNPGQGDQDGDGVGDACAAVSGLSCEPGLTSCEGACVDLLASSAHCGQCGQACRSDQICQNGACACNPGFTECNGRCVECGACGLDCSFMTNAIYASCVNFACACSGPLPGRCGNACVDLQMDMNNCGFCGNVCAIGCIGGSCK